MDLQEIEDFSSNLRTQIQKVVVGQTAATDLMLVALLTQGHILLEGVPGTAKTLLARVFAKSLSLDFGRIQFTPDLMPGDVLGTNLFDFQSNQFHLTKGPIFTQLLLADEINRTPPKTQAALLQAMQERMLTIDGQDYSLGEGFLVIATQNPIEQQGTYPLPEAQLDRFLFKHILEYPSEKEELEIVNRHGHVSVMPDLESMGIEIVADLDRIQNARKQVQAVKLSEDIVKYIVGVIRATREHPSIEFGASPRAANMIATASRAYAALSGRDYVIPDDVKFLALPALRHRLVLAPGADIEGLQVEQVIGQILEQQAAPR